MLVRFSLTVRKNYRNVPYHNWTHAFTVTQAMYMLIKRAGDALSPFEVLHFYLFEILYTSIFAINGISTNLPDDIGYCAAGIVCLS